MTIHKGYDLTSAVVAVIAADGWTVGEGIAPAGVGWQGTPGQSNFTPYVVVHPTPGGVFDGTIGNPFDDARVDYVIHAYGATQQQCQVVADRVFGVLTTATLTVAGRFVQLVIPDVEGGVVRDDDVQPSIFYSPTRWRIWTTPS